MDGGKLIATGSSSCVIRPMIPCKKGKNKINDKRISKLISHKDSKNMMKYEKKQIKLIKNIKGYKNWCILYDEYCKAPEYEELVKYDPEGIHDCYQEIDYHPNSYLLNSKYGGKTMLDVFRNKFENISTNNIKNEFLDFMIMMKPLFYGVQQMNNHGVIHNDIKYNNVVLDNGDFKFIDFGLTSSINDKHNFKERGIYEYNTDRLYLYYPLDYIFYYINDKERINEEFTIYNRNDYDILNMVYLSFNRSIPSVLQKHIRQMKNNEIKEIDMINGIDVYGLGIIVPLLINLFSNILYNEHPIINQFYNLFYKMTDTIDKRIKPDKAYKEYLKLISKYTHKRQKKYYHSKKSKKKTIRGKK